MIRLAAHGLKNSLAGPFDIELGRGECLAITGVSGAGKSLFLRMIADLDVNEGEVLLDGAPRVGMPAPQWRRLAPYVAAETGWWHPMAADHFEAVHCAQAKALAGRLGVAVDQFDGEVSRLSTGERQRLALVRALVLASPVLLLDEPTGPLDPESVARVETLLLERLEAGTTIVLVSHDPAQPARLGALHRVMRDRRLEPAS